MIIKFLIEHLETTTKIKLKIVKLHQVLLTWLKSDTDKNTNINTQVFYSNHLRDVTICLDAGFCTIFPDQIHVIKTIE